jgi:hypothetical protein
VQLTTGGDFGEYYEPFTGEPIGSLAQSWTAAVALAVGGLSTEPGPDRKLMLAMVMLVGANGVRAEKRVCAPSSTSAQKTIALSKCTEGGALVETARILSQLLTPL